MTGAPQQPSTTIWKLEHAHPRYWGVWLMLGVAWLVTRLPHPARLAIGRGIGAVGYHLARERRHIVEVNLRLCFPDQDDEAHQAMVRDVFASVGMSVIETAIAWLVPTGKLRHLFRFHNTEVLTAAQREGRGVILLGMHLATLDIAGCGFSTQFVVDVMYRKNKNALLEALMTSSRERNFPWAIERDDVKQVIRNLRAGHIVWYGADQDYGAKHSVFAPFFGIQAASIKATARIAKITGSPIVIYTHYRREDGTYDMYCERMTTPFPVDDDVTNATIINQVVEDAVRKAPAQYWWLHRRFKTRPPGEPRPY